MIVGITITISISRWYQVVEISAQVHEMNCPICIDYITDVYFVAGCGHPTCKHCAIRLYLASGSSSCCPVCRTPSDVDRLRQLWIDASESGIEQRRSINTQASFTPGEVQPRLLLAMCCARMGQNSDGTFVELADRRMYFSPPCCRIRASCGGWGGIVIHVAAMWTQTTGTCKRCRLALASFTTHP